MTQYTHPIPTRAARSPARCARIRTRLEMSRNVAKCHRRASNTKNEPNGAWRRAPHPNSAKRTQSNPPKNRVASLPAAICPARRATRITKRTHRDPSRCRDPQIALPPALFNSIMPAVSRTRRAIQFSLAMGSLHMSAKKFRAQPSAGRVSSMVESLEEIFSERYF